ncbi:MAG TPA: hypothetical protein VF292_02970 [Rhodanobacteraceae bacterium]
MSYKSRRRAAAADPDNAYLLYPMTCMVFDGLVYGARDVFRFAVALVTDVALLLAMVGALLLHIAHARHQQAARSGAIPLNPGYIARDIALHVVLPFLGSFGAIPLAAALQHIAWFRGVLGNIVVPLVSSFAAMFLLGYALYQAHIIVRHLWRRTHPRAAASA